MLVNYVFGETLSKYSSSSLKKVLNKKVFLTLGLIANVGLLGYFKYADFFIENVNLVFQTNIALLKIALPLAISFFTFQQIAYLVDSYKGETGDYSFIRYCVFVTFFPQLIAGPIVHHKDMMPQFENKGAQELSHKNIYDGVTLFVIGLFKKVICTVWVERS